MGRSTGVNLERRVLSICICAFSDPGAGFQHQKEGANHESCSLRLLKKDVLGNPIWIVATEDLGKASVRIEELAFHSPGEYIVFNQQTSQIVTALGGWRR
jgi:hypothetical protein